LGPLFFVNWQIYKNAPVLCIVGPTMTEQISTLVDTLPIFICRNAIMGCVCDFQITSLVPFPRLQIADCRLQIAAVEDIGLGA